LPIFVSANRGQITPMFHVKHLGAMFFLSFMMGRLR
jgi:hypothetical protein